MTVTAKDVLAWMETAGDSDLREIADEILERGLATSNEDYAELNSELQASYEDDRDDDLLREAAARLRRKDFSEGLHLLATALGRDFDVLEDMKVSA